MVTCPAVPQRLDVFLLQPKVANTSEQYRRCVRGPHEDQRIQGVIGRYHLLALSSMDRTDQDRRAQVEELLVQRYGAVVHVQGVRVANVSVRVQIAGAENYRSVGIGHRDLQEDVALGYQPRGHAVAIGQVLHFNVELKSLVSFRDSYFTESVAITQ